MSRWKTAGALALLVAVAVAAVAVAAESAGRKLSVETKAAIPAALVKAGWKAEKRTVTVATPKGDEKKEIVYYTNSLGMRFVQVPAGEFVMGSPAAEAGRFDNEGPQHKVKITKAFMLGATEVTNAQYRQFKREHDSGDWRGSTLNGDDQPVVEVSWDDAVAFCKWLSGKEGVTYRLPTEAEWEYACRAGTTTRFYFGDADASLHRYANYADKRTSFGWSDKDHDDGYTVSAPVGKFTPNAFGLYDMIGNVWEWCSDWHGAYADSAATDPQGPATGQLRVLRGGSWSINPQVCRSALRVSDLPVYRLNFIGFRVVVVFSPRPSNP